jgi:hypothetical protein
LVQAFLKKWWVESDFKAPNIFCASTLKLQWKESSNSNDHQCHQHQQREQSTTILMELIEHKNKSPLHMTWLTYFPPINLLFYKPLYKNMLSLSLRHQYFITFELTLGNSCIIVSIGQNLCSMYPHRDPWTNHQDACMNLQKRVSDWVIVV